MSRNDSGVRADEMEDSHEECSVDLGNQTMSPGQSPSRHSINFKDQDTKTNGSNNTSNTTNNGTNADPPIDIPGRSVLSMSGSVQDKMLFLLKEIEQFSEQLLGQTYAPAGMQQRYRGDNSSSNSNSNSGGGGSSGSGSLGSQKDTATAIGSPPSGRRSPGSAASQGGRWPSSVPPGGRPSIVTPQDFISILEAKEEHESGGISTPPPTTKSTTTSKNSSSSSSSSSSSGGGGGGGVTKAQLPEPEQKEEENDVAPSSKNDGNCLSLSVVIPNTTPLPSVPSNGDVGVARLLSQAPLPPPLPAKGQGEGRSPNPRTQPQQPLLSVAATTMITPSQTITTTIPTDTTTKLNFTNTVDSSSESHEFQPHLKAYTLLYALYQECRTQGAQTLSGSPSTLNIGGGRHSTVTGGENDVLSASDLITSTSHPSFIPTAPGRGKSGSLFHVQQFHRHAPRPQSLFRVLNHTTASSGSSVRSSTALCSSVSARSQYDQNDANFLLAPSSISTRANPFIANGGGGHRDSIFSVMSDAAVKEANHAEHGLDDMGFETINNYAILEELGRGNFGKVMLACDEEGNQVAIKSMACGVKAPKHRFGGFGGGGEGSRSRATSTVSSFAANRIAQSFAMKEPDSMVMREVAIMKKLRHKNIVQLREVIHDEEEDQTHLVMDYICNGAVAEMGPDGTCVSTVKEITLAKNYLRQCATGLEYLHRQGICHRDVKPENILIGAAQDAYLADFGVSAVMREDKVVDISAGTQMFFSPELCRGDYDEAAKYGKQSDIWALGATFFAVMFGKVPFHAPNLLALAASILTNPVPFPEDLPTDDPLREIFEGLLEKDPKKRWSLKHLRSFLDGKIPTTAHGASLVSPPQVQKDAPPWMRSPGWADKLRTEVNAHSPREKGMTPIELEIKGGFGGSTSTGTPGQSPRDCENDSSGLASLHFDESVEEFSDSANEEFGVTMRGVSVIEVSEEEVMSAVVASRVSFYKPAPPSGLPLATPLSSGDGGAPLSSTESARSEVTNNPSTVVGEQWVETAPHPPPKPGGS